MRGPLNRGKSTLIHDLKSFLQHSPSDSSSTVYRGTLFEWQTHQVLEQTLGMRLRRVGGKSDGGVDLRGTWPLRDLPLYKHQRPFRIDIAPSIIVQCKNTKAGCSPDHVRALIGAAGALNPQSSIAMLATSSNKRYTADVISHFMDSHMPLALARICNVRLDSLLFNPAAETVLQGLTIATQFDSHGSPAPILMHDGDIVDRDTSCS